MNTEAQTEAEAAIDAFIASATEITEAHNHGDITTAEMQTRYAALWSEFFL